MEKGGKTNKQQKGYPEPQPEPEVQEEQEESQESEESEECSEDDEIGLSGSEPSDDGQQILDRIDEEISKSEHPLKLTWAAIQELKKQEKQLDEEMDAEMSKMRAKFDVLKAPLIHQIAEAANGRPLQKQIYTHHELTKSLSVNKNKPQAIAEFWRNGLAAVGFEQCQQDEQILSNCISLRVDASTPQPEGNPEEEQRIRAAFQFSKNSVISNIQLTIQVGRKGEQFITMGVTPIEFKCQVPDNSAFAQLFNPDIGEQRLHQLCQNIKSVYNNSIFYYFYGLRQSEGMKSGNNEKGDRQQKREPALKQAKTQRKENQIHNAEQLGRVK